MKKQKIIAIAGPTASGKSTLAVKMAKKFNGEIISADSRQVYKFLNVGSGKITKSEMKNIRHYCLGVIHPEEPFTVADYKRCAEKAIAKIADKGKVPFIVGGTGFYIRTVLGGIAIPEVAPDKNLREKLKKISTAELYKILARLDPDRARVIGHQNKQRLIRAIEIVKTTGKPVPKLKRLQNFKVLMIGIKKTPQFF